MKKRASNLAVVEGTVDGKVEDVLIGNSRHLGFLDGRDAALRVEDEDGDVGFRAKTVDGGAVGQTHQRKHREERRRKKETNDPVSPEVAPTTVNRSRSSSDLPSFLLFKKNSKRLPRN